MVLFNHFAKALTLGGLAFCLLPAPGPVPALLQQAGAQAFPGRLRRPPPGRSNYPAPNAQPSTPAAPANAAPPPASAAPAPQPATPSPLPPSMLQQPAQPATIQFSAQSLSIHADNSSLREILHQLAQKTGMDVQGFGNDERVFGSFGPGNPQDVVNDLLNGTSYNVLMVGVLSNGAPRQLVLSPASHVAASAAPSSPPPPAADNDDDDPPDRDTQNVPPDNSVQNPRPGEPSSHPSPTARSPQEMFQQLQQMRQQQQQQPQQ